MLQIALSTACVALMPTACSSSSGALSCRRDQYTAAVKDAATRNASAILLNLASAVWLFAVGATCFRQHPVDLSARLSGELHRNATVPIDHVTIRTKDGTQGR